MVMNFSCSTSGSAFFGMGRRYSRSCNWYRSSCNGVIWYRMEVARVHGYDLSSSKYCWRSSVWVTH